MSHGCSNGNILFSGCLYNFEDRAIVEFKDSPIDKITEAIIADSSIDNEAISIRAICGFQLSASIDHRVSSAKLGRLAEELGSLSLGQVGIYVSCVNKLYSNFGLPWYAEIVRVISCQEANEHVAEQQVREVKAPFGNHYGIASCRREGGKYFFVMGDYDGDFSEEVSESFFNAWCDEFGKPKTTNHEKGDR